MRVLIYCGSAISTLCGSPLISLPSIFVVYCGSSVLRGSATRTAPPWIRATPATAADSFAAASLSDICPNLALPPWLDTAPPHRHQIQCFHGHLEVAGAMRLTTNPGRNALQTSQIRHVSPSPSRFDTALDVPVSNNVSWIAEFPRPGQSSKSCSCAPPERGGDIPKCSHPASLSTRPRAVRASRPSWMR